MTIIIFVWFIICIIGISKEKISKSQWLETSACVPIRGIGCISIVIVHSWNYSSNNPIAEFLYSYFVSSGYLMVAIFFFFSGYGLMTNYLSKENYLKHFIKKKIIDILMLYWLVNVIYIVLYAIFNIEFTVKQAIGSFGLPILNWNAWYVFTIFITYIVFFICGRKNMDKKWIIIFQSIWIILYSIICVSFNFGSWWYISNGSYILGLIVASYKSKVYKLISKKLFLLFSILIFFYCYTMTFLGDYFFINETTIKVIQYITCILYVFILISTLSFFKIGNPFLKFVGIISYEIYLIHGCIENIIHAHAKILPNELQIVIITSITIILSYYIHIMNLKIKTIFYPIK